ncbi:MAG: nitrilase-related carbon-nitrogen hydrolase [Acidobacteriota bacterium]
MMAAASPSPSAGSDAQRPLRVAAAQIDLEWEDRRSNLARLDDWVASAVDRDARLVLFPEMFPTGFSMSVERVAEPWDGPSVQRLVELATRHGAWIGGSIAELPPGADPDQQPEAATPPTPRPRNTFVLASPAGSLHRYAKRFGFSPAGEGARFAAGDDRLVVPIDGVRCALAVCYDLRFAPEFWDQALDVEAFLVVANWPEARRQHWRTLLAARAIENQAYVVGVNRVGEGGGLRYAGDSAVIDPLGEHLASAAHQEALLVADLDPQRVRAVRAELPFLGDRRDAPAVQLVESDGLASRRID